MKMKKIITSPNPRSYPTDSAHSCSCSYRQWLRPCRMRNRVRVEVDRIWTDQSRMRSRLASDTLLGLKKIFKNSKGKSKSPQPFVSSSSASLKFCRMYSRTRLSLVWSNREFFDFVVLENNILSHKKGKCVLFWEHLELSRELTACPRVCSGQFQLQFLLLQNRLLPQFLLFLTVSVCKNPHVFLSGKAKMYETEEKWDYK